MKEQENTEEKIVEHFSMRSVWYDSTSTWVKNEDILKKMIHFLPEEKKRYRILDLGAGTGAVSKYVLEHYDESVVVIAVDCCKSMLEKIGHPDIFAVQANVKQLPFLDHSFDIVISRQCLHYVDDLNTALTEVKRVLKNKGIFVLAQIVPYDIKTAPYWSEVTKIRQPLRKKYFTAEEWNEVIKDIGFKVLLCDRIVHKGSVNKWAKKYSISKQDIINQYRSKLLNADENYKAVYCVQIEENDISYNTFWHIVKYQL